MFIIQKPTMNFLSAILIVGFMAVSECNALLKPQENRRIENVEKRAVAPILRCGTCTLPQNLNLSGIVDAAKDLGPVFREFALLISDVFGGFFLNLEDLNQALTAVLTSLRDGVSPFFDKLSVAVQNVVTCPPLRTFFKTLKNNVIAVLDSLINTWPKLLKGTETRDLLSALSQALVSTAPQIVQTLRDSTTDLIIIVQLPITVTVTCPILVTVVWRHLDPSTSGPVTAPLILLFESLNGQSGPTSTDVINGILADFDLPPISIPGLSGVDLTQLIKALSCGFVNSLFAGGFSGLCNGV